jgi:hypothetical protein
MGQVFQHGADLHGILRSAVGRGEEIQMALLHREKPWEEERRRIIADAEELRRQHPVPDQEEVLSEMQRIRESLPKDLRITDSTILLREDRER